MSFGEIACGSVSSADPPVQATGATATGALVAGGSADRLKRGNVCDFLLVGESVGAVALDSPGKALEIRLDGIGPLVSRLSARPSAYRTVTVVGPGVSGCVRLRASTQALEPKTVNLI